MKICSLWNIISHVTPTYWCYIYQYVAIGYKDMIGPLPADGYDLLANTLVQCVKLFLQCNEARSYRKQGSVMSLSQPSAELPDANREAYQQLGQHSHFTSSALSSQHVPWIEHNVRLSSQHKRVHEWDAAERTVSLMPTLKCNVLRHLKNISNVFLYLCTI